MVPGLGYLQSLLTHFCILTLPELFIWEFAFWLFDSPRILKNVDERNSVVPRSSLGKKQCHGYFE